MMDYGTVLAAAFTLLQQEADEPCCGKHCLSAGI